MRAKTSAVCGPHLQSSAEEEVAQTSAVCNKKTKEVPVFVVKKSGEIGRNRLKSLKRSGA
ncbi:hypothetical protein LXL04_030067 [Taraxacum kok-saghyz]